MGLRCAKCVLTFPLILSIVLLLSFAAWGNLVEMTTGAVLNGTTTGMAPLLRLQYSPHLSFDIPTASVVQMVIDFPRVIVETPERVYIGPYSAFSGIDDVLTLQQGDARRDLPFAAVRAIAFHGNPLHKVPRLWLDEGYLKTPTVLSIATPAGKEEPAPVGVTEETTPPQTWGDLYQSPVTQQSEETPWWVLLLITAGLGVLVYLSL